MTEFGEDLWIGFEGYEMFLIVKVVHNDAKGTSSCGDVLKNDSPA
jgi:hypothetical protein